MPRTSNTSKAVAKAGNIAAKLHTLRLVSCSNRAVRSLEFHHLALGPTTDGVVGEPKGQWVEQVVPGTLVHLA